MREQHFHATRHIKGGLDIDETTLSDNATYWKSCASGAYLRGVKALGENKAFDIFPEREPGQTWKNVCECYEILADLAEHQIVFVSRIGGTDLYLDVAAVKESVKKIKADYLASVNHANDDFWAARNPRITLKQAQAIAEYDDGMDDAIIGSLT
jgi:hypothetical protein